MPIIPLETIRNALVAAAGLVLLYCLPVLAQAAVRWLNAHQSKLEAEAQVVTAAMQAGVDVQPYFELAVRAAEQYLKSADGQAKKAWVINLAQVWLASRGIQLPLAEIEARVEAAVWTELNQGQAASPARP